jgi:tetratricopeptide (TPR) repeat protein
MTLLNLYRTGILCLVLCITLLLVACGEPSPELIYRVSGEDTTQASVSYADADANLQAEQIDLPWEISFEIGNKFDAEIDVINEKSGTITCEIWLDGRKIGSSSSAVFARCVDFYARSGNGTVNSFVGGSLEKYLAKKQDYVDKRDYEQALKEIEHVIEKVPNAPEGYQQQGIIYAKMDENDEAVAAFTRAIELDPTQKMTYFDRATTYWEMDDLEAAIADLTTAIELDPEFMNGYMIRAVIYGQLGDLEAATADVLHVQALGDDHDTQVWVADKLRQYEQYAPGPGINARIAFVSRRKDNVDIYSMNADGSDEQRLTDQPGIDDTPAWSPDGQTIAFTSDIDGNKEIYLMNPDGSNKTRLTNHPATDQMPVWSPTSHAVAFVSERNGNADIYIYNLETEELTQITTSSTNEWHPAWSPNTPELAFVSDADGDPDIYIANAELEVRQLTNYDGGDSHPSWSPNGRYIAFAVTPDGKTSDLYMIEPDGSGAQQLTQPGTGLNLDPAWSPDSNSLAFASERDGETEIYVLTEAGEEFRLTDNNVVDARPTWGPSVGP